MLESVNAFFGSPHFNYYCIIAAALLLGFSDKRYKFIALAVFLEFLLHKLAYNHLLLDYRSGNKYAIYYIYASIQLPIIYALYKLKGHFLITALITANMIYNLSIPLAFVNAEFISIYWFKDLFIGIIMIVELLYLAWLCQYVFFHKRKYDSVDYDRIDRLFYVGGNVRARGVL